MTRAQLLIATIFALSTAFSFTLATEGALFYGGLLFSLVALPSAGILIHNLTYQEWPVGVDAFGKRVAIFFGALLTATGLVVASSILLTDASGFLRYFFGVLFLVGGVLELGTGVIYVFLGERLFSIVRQGFGG